MGVVSVAGRLGGILSPILLLLVSYNRRDSFSLCYCMTVGRSESGTANDSDVLSGTDGWSPESPPPRDPQPTSS